MTRVARSNGLLRRVPYLLLLALAVVSLTYASSRRKVPRAPAQEGPSDLGQWEVSFTTTNNPMAHATVLPNGKLLYWTYAPPFQTADSHLWNCVINSQGLCDPDVIGANKQAIPYSTLDLFCGGHSLLPNGQLFVAGGNLFERFGPTTTTIFNLDPSPSATPISGPAMTDGRWYPSTVTLGNGETAIVSGDYCARGVPGNCNAIEFNDIPEVLSSNGASLRRLTGAARPLSWYPWLHLASDGRVFHAGPVSPSRWLNTVGTGSWGLTEKPYYYSQSPDFITDRQWGSSVMYDVDKVLISGGGVDVASDTAETIDLTNEAGNWTPTARMAFPRRHHNLTILADGTVFATGGTSGPGFNNTCLRETVLWPELWDPNTGTWTTKARMSIRRQYHSIAVLLIDGRVLTGGTTAQAKTFGCTSLLPQLQQEIFTPPYLFNTDGTLATRPVIDSAPETIDYGTQFLINTPNPTNIHKVTLVRLSSVTHSTNMNQRFNNLTFSRVLAGLLVNAPASNNQVPPGHYMLFIFNKKVPSVAKIVRIQ